MAKIRNPHAYQPARPSKEPHQLWKDKEGGRAYAFYAKDMDCHQLIKKASHILVVNKEADALAFFTTKTMTAASREDVLAVLDQMKLPYF